MNGISWPGLFLGTEDGLPPPSCFIGEDGPSETAGADSLAE